MPDDESPLEYPSGGPAGEIMSCISCRNRKLKCDRTKPRCNRCERAESECIYPESRRKPTFKRPSVKELEARLAQVEVLLKEVGEKRSSHEKAAEPAEIPPSEIPPAEILPAEVPAAEHGGILGMGFEEPDIFLGPFSDDASFPFQPDPPATAPVESSDGQDPHSSIPLDGKLIDLGGVFESLPPFEVMEELNRLFFEHHQPLLPIIHPCRYQQAFHSAPHMKPPMCLQYAIWALTTSGYPRYEACHDIFYRRARQYAELDELKGHGEHFITVAHAQAWCVIATYEAKNTMFTRAAMSCSRAVRLVSMMGLHRLDGASEEISPALLPPRDWIELEERRRVFWGVFGIDSHCSISTGWPQLIDVSEITTLLPASDSAFNRGEPEQTTSLHDAFKGRVYSSFAGAILVCHIFNQILKHVNKPKPNDNPDNYEYGEYWQRHREIDNTLSSAFMNMPESFRLPENYRDLIAVHTNLNLHASIICLHHSAIDAINTFSLPDFAKKASEARLTAAAREIVYIIKLTSQVNLYPKSPLAALSLYCAATVFIYLCKESPTGANLSDLHFIIATMDGLSEEHVITRFFLHQLVLDIERNDLGHIVKLPSLSNLSAEDRANVPHNIPLLARCAISRHSQVLPPLPGRLPLGRPLGKVIPVDNRCDYASWTTPPLIFEDPSPESDYSRSNKRKRNSPSSGIHAADGDAETCTQFLAGNGSNAEASCASSAHPSPAEAFVGGSNAAATSVPTSHAFFSDVGGPSMQHVDLPHGTGPPVVNGDIASTLQQDNIGGGGSGGGIIHGLGSSSPSANIRAALTVLRSMDPRPLFAPPTREHDQTQMPTGAGNGAEVGANGWYMAGASPRTQFAYGGDASTATANPNAHLHWRASGTSSEHPGNPYRNFPWGLMGG
ncbi:fungal-specific transcription factor domain-containing protein [Durotheca rogersii]|uniref:fungal-specific transcription factor domain-containing protein n=1 Tax=Durotheca rogersii TaxID=419775 RepID=UPI00222041B5|nr:fungal-specific transcription factor domain-containing protein [Durotheca rogersii]KAI5868090.1 fungal-specific transcription factor domain-containing protein [Durotheca rogersii]